MTENARRMRLHSSVPTIGPIRPGMHRELLKHVEKLSAATRELSLFGKYKTLIDKLVEPGSFCFEFETTYSRNSLPTAILFSHTPEEEWPVFERICYTIDEVLYEKGYRKRIQTHQEHDLIDSDLETKYSKRLYAPMRVIDCRAASIKEVVEETQFARSLELFWGADRAFYGLPQGRFETGVPVLLEELDNHGNTARDPRPVDRTLFLKYISKSIALEEAIEKSIIPHTKSRDYPHRRD